MVAFAALIASILYLIPVAVVTFDWTGRREVRATALALALPNIVAVDLLAIFASALFMRLEAAVLLVRVSWVLVAITLFVRHKRRARAPSATAVDLSTLGAVVASALAATYLSTLWSNYSVWDRFWHIPLVASLRGQQLPFKNVFYFASPLRYHFSGDVLAATLQTLSFGVINSDHALSLAHDVMFGLTGCCLALLLRGVGHRSVSVIVLSVLAILFNGPVSNLRGEGASALHGYSVLNFFTMSFRPHVSLAGLLFVGFFGAIIVRLRDETSASSEAGPWLFRASATLLTTTSVLGISDETSTGLLGLALGATWLVQPAIIHPDRRRGLLLLVGLLVAFLGVNYLVGGSLAPGGPVHGTKWVAARSPGYFGAPVQLALREGWRLLIFDVLAIPTAFAGLLLCWRRGDARGLGAAILFLGVLNTCSLLGLTRFEVNGAPVENHRFATAALFAAPLFALAWLPRTLRGSHAKLVLLAAIVLPAMSTASWFRNAAPRELAVEWQPLLGSVNCRSQAGARTQEAARASYVAASSWYLWSGCHPTLTPGIPGPTWGLPILGPLHGLAAIDIMDKHMLAADQDLPLVCPADTRRVREDAVCSFGVEQRACKNLSAELQTCALDPSQRSALLRALRQ